MTTDGNSPTGDPTAILHTIFEDMLKRTGQSIPVVIEKAGQALANSAQDLHSWSYKHPTETAVILISFLLGALALSAWVLPLLNAAGFTIQGICNGSTAAGIHSIIKVVAPKSVFSLLQSAGAGGAGTWMVTMGAAGIGDVAAMGAAVGAVKARL